MSTQRKLKKQSISNLKKKLWKFFSEYIKKRDNYTCITCGRYAKGQGMHSGHYIPRSIGGIALYFDERNVNAQCYHCNINLGGFGAKYKGAMIDKYGAKAEKKLWKIQTETHQWKEKDYLEKIEYYRKLNDSPMA